MHSPESTQNQSSNNQAVSVSTSISTPSLKEAFWFWLKLGFISFGGPAGQIATMHQELVERKKWISEENFLHALNYCMLLPGPEAQQLATYLGWLMHRTWGGIMAGVLFILPSLLLFIGLSWAYLIFGQQTWLITVFDTIKPAVIAIIFFAAYKMGKKTLTNVSLTAVCLITFISLLVFNIPFPLVILGAGMAGLIYCKVKPSKRVEVEVEAEAQVVNQTKLSPQHFFRIGLSGALLWSIPFVLLISVFGWGNTYSQMSWFFTKAAFLTFGGAYAVLPYVHQASVEHFQWLTSTQILDGLALGEVTPGPLIMIVAFVGFLASFKQELLGIENLFWAGALGAVVATWFTFLPSFMFILLGAPLVEASKQYNKLNQILRFITAAVVGMILHLGSFFMMHVYWPQGFTQNPELLSIAITVASLYLLLMRRWSIIQIIGLCLLFAGFRVFVL
jgi:chromate transporter